ncbi:MAG: inositol monophosphatase [Lachnospiraceae bacterium]|nr:inositol monophosphatase [Lachnospiraceae bacterium]
MDKIYEQIKTLAKDCGEIIKSASREEIEIDAKEGHANFVTRYDKLVQDRLMKGLKEIMPEAAFFGEEGEHNGFPEDDLVFIVDPIDGTTNFLKGLNLSCIAIALVHKKERIFGLVYNPFTSEMFTAVKGQGAFLNGKKIKVSSEPLDMGLVIFGTSPYYPGLPDKAFKLARYYLEKSIDVRRLGSAEIDLCYIACGRAELYFEPLLQPWDFAAGSLIVEEAGGRAMTFEGNELDFRVPCSCVAFGSGIKIDRMPEL